MMLHYTIMTIKQMLLQYDATYDFFFSDVIDMKDEKRPCPVTFSPIKLQPDPP